MLDENFDTKTTPAISPFLWGGSLYEPETNLYWMRNRYYHIGMHRFINQDPIGIWGDANNLGNGFAYVAGMVIEAADPTGLEYNDNDMEIGERIQQQGTFQYMDAYNKTMNSTYFNEYRALEEIAKGIFQGSTGIAFARAILNALKSGSPEDIANSLVALTSALKKPGFAEILQNGLNGFLKGAAKYEWENNLLVVTYGNGDVRYFDSKGNVYKKVGDQWYIQTSEGGWFKDEKWEKCDKPAESTMPSDPDSGNDAVQNYLMNNVLKDMLKLKTDEKGKNPLEELGPVINHDDNGIKIFIFNPYYRGKDPMEEVLWRIKTDSGMWGFIRNPFAPGAEYGYDSTTYEKFQQKGFIQPEVDPYWE